MVRFSPIKAAVTFLLITGALFALVGRVAYLQTYGRENTIRSAERQQHQTETLFARRGSIFDSTGLLMAGTVQKTSLFLDPKFMQDQYQEDGRSLIDMDADVVKLAKLLDKKPFDISKMLGDRATSRYVRIADDLDDTTIKEIEQLKLPGAGFTPVNQRYYPMGSLGAHILGGVGGEGTGIEGLELKYEKQLAGKDGSIRMLKDARRRAIAVAADDYLPPQNGQHLILTIDANIQMIAEQELANSCEQFAAKRGEVVVMDPTTGDVLALANWPTFNPQNLEDSTQELRRDRCLTDPYEPGSTLKPFIAGPAFAQHITTPTEILPIPGLKWSTPYGRTITDVHGYGKLAMWDVLVKSSNIGMSMLGERMGNPRLYEALTHFGFGKQTGIELPGESEGMVNPLRKWGKYSTESISQGYELMVTPLQLARGMCAYANGGHFIQPRIVKGMLDDGGEVIAKISPKSLNQTPMVIDADTAAQMRRILADVVVRGTAEKARSNIYNVFGKTGTAHISRNGTYSEQAFNSSFLGGAPFENPKLVIAMIIHEPDKSKGHYGGAVSAPGAVHALERSLEYLQVPASPTLAPPPPNVANVLWEFNPKLYQGPTQVSMNTQD